jgi:hypothetical protein
MALFDQSKLVALRLSPPCLVQNVRFCPILPKLFLRRRLIAFESRVALFTVILDYVERLPLKKLGVGFRGLRDSSLIGIVELLINKLRCLRSLTRLETWICHHIAVLCRVIVAYLGLVHFGLRTYQVSVVRLVVISALNRLMIEFIDYFVTI